jgi:hypothetical protein
MIAGNVRRSLLAGMRLWLCLAWLLLSAAAPAQASPQVVVIYLPGMRVEHLRDPALPNLNAMAKTGQVGLMAVPPRGDNADTLSLLRQELGAQWERIVFQPGRGEPDLRAALRRLDIFASSLIVSPAPTRLMVLSPPSEDARRRRTGLILLSGEGLAPGMLTSAATRTPGLIVNTDAIHLLQSWLSGSPPSADLRRLPRPLSVADPLTDLTRLDRIIVVNRFALVPVGILLGTLAALIGFGGIAVLSFRPAMAARFAFPLLCLMNAPLALLLIVPVMTPFWRLSTGRSVGADAACLTVGILLLMLAGAVLQRKIAVRRQEPESVVRRLAMTSALLILADTLTGNWLTRFNLLSSYQTGGTRFYGIGNEYMSFLIGTLLLWHFLQRETPRRTLILFALAVFVIGFPRLGANAGGVIAAVTAFGVAGILLRGRPARGWHAALWMLAGAASAVGFAVLDRMLPDGGFSHLGGALETAKSQGGYGYLWSVIGRKLLMHLNILAHPAVILSVLSLAVVSMLTRRALRREREALFARHPLWARSLPAFGYGAAAAFLFNDSGIVAALFLIGAFLLPGLYIAFTDAGTISHKIAGATLRARESAGTPHGANAKTEKGRLC